MPLEYRGYAVHIECEGEELPQYAVEKTDESTMTCWIPSQAGKAFSVHFSTLERHAHARKTVRVFADGRRLAGWGTADGEDDVIEYRSISANTRQPFIFSEVAFAPDEDEDVQIWVAVQVRHSEPFQKFEKSTVVDGGIQLTEKSKLIGANHVKPGASEVYVPEVSYVSSRPIGNKPYALFRFKHRPAAILQAMGIMPKPVRSQSPPQASTASRQTRRQRSDSNQAESSVPKRQRVDEEEDVKPNIDQALEERRRKIQEEMEQEEAKAAARQAALRAQLEELGPSDAGHTRVKAERVPSPISVPRPGEVIDLTDD